MPDDPPSAKSSAPDGGDARGWTPPAPEDLARLLPNYDVLSLLGRGGMGAVYLAVQTALDREVAIKLLPLEVSTDPAFADRFVREARAMADSGTDLWDGSIDAPLNVNEFGTTVSALSVWTGSKSNGAGIDSQFGELGSPNEYGHGTGSTGITTAGWIAGPRSSATNAHSFYGVSQVLTAPEPTSALLLLGSGAMLLLRRRRAAV